MRGMGRKWDVFLYEEYIKNVGCIFLLRKNRVMSEIK